MINYSYIKICTQSLTFNDVEPKPMRFSILLLDYLFAIN